MEYRLRRVPQTAFRIVRDRVGNQVDEGLRRLIEMWADGEVDPFGRDSAGKAARTGVAAPGGAISGQRVG